MHRIQSRQALAMVLLPPIAASARRMPRASRKHHASRDPAVHLSDRWRAAPTRRLYWPDAIGSSRPPRPYGAPESSGLAGGHARLHPAHASATGHWSPLVQSVGGGRSTADLSGGSESASGMFPEERLAADVAASDGSAAGARGPSKNRAEQVIQGLGLGARSRRRRSSPLTAEDAAKQVVQAEPCAALLLAP